LICQKTFVNDGVTIQGVIYEINPTLKERGLCLEVPVDEY
jgi:hypothetical protein